MQTKQKVEIKFKLKRENGNRDRKTIELDLLSNKVFQLRNTKKGLAVIKPELNSFIDNEDQISGYTYRVLIKDIVAKKKKEITKNERLKRTKRKANNLLKQYNLKTKKGKAELYLQRKEIKIATAFEEFQKGGNKYRYYLKIFFSFFDNPLRKFMFGMGVY